MGTPALDMRVAAIFVVCVAFAAGLADDDGIAQLSETELGTPPQGGVDQQVVKAVEAKMAHAVRSPCLFALIMTKPARWRAASRR